MPWGPLTGVYRRADVLNSTAKAEPRGRENPGVRWRGFGRGGLRRHPGRAFRPRRAASSPAGSSASVARWEGR